MRYQNLTAVSLVFIAELIGFDLMQLRLNCQATQAAEQATITAQRHSTFQPSFALLPLSRKDDPIVPPPHTDEQPPIVPPAYADEDPIVPTNRHPNTINS